MNTRWDFHTLWFMQFDSFTQSSIENPPNNQPLVNSYNIDISQCSAYQFGPQTPTIPTNQQAETTALLAAMTTQPLQARINLINTLIASLKSYTTSLNGQTLWQALDFLYVIANFDSTGQAGRINWKNPSQIATVIGSPTYVTDRGYAGFIGKKGAAA